MTKAGPSGVFVGLTTLDIISRVDSLPSANQKVTASRQDISAGGPAANAAVTFAALGGEATLVTCIGQGILSAAALRDLEQHGVHVIDCAPAGFDLAVSSITVTEHSGDRAVVSTDGNGATRRPVLDNHAEALTQILDIADVVLFDGHYPSLADETLSLLRGCTREPQTVLDAGRWKPQFEFLTPQVDFVVASEDFTDPYGWVPAELSELSTLPTTVIRTRGAKPVFWWHKKSSGSVEVAPVTAVDTLGAGDVFHGAFSYAVSRQQNEARILSEAELRKAIDYAARTTALKLKHYGTRGWLSLLNTESAKA